MHDGVDGQRGCGAGYRSADRHFLRGGDIVDPGPRHVDELAAACVEPESGFGTIDLRHNGGSRALPPDTIYFSPRLYTA
jgi:hypothetical protein